MPCTSNPAPPDQPSSPPSRPTDRPPSGIWSCPSASRLQPADTCRAAWLQARRSGVGGSELAALLGVSPYDSALSVWLDKTGRAADDADPAPSEAMQWGARLEAAVADAFAEQHRVQLRRAGLMRCRAHPRMLATVDRLCSDGGGLEVKCVGYFTGRQLTDRAIPPHWYWQCVHYLAVTGRRHWWLAVLVGGQQLQVRRIDRDRAAADLQRAVEAVERFWREHVDTDRPPTVVPFGPAAPLPGSAVEAPLPGQALADTARWRQLERQTRLLQGELAAVKGRLADQLGEAQLLTVGGRPLVRRVVRRGANRLDVAALRRGHPQIAARYTVTGAASSHLELYRDTHWNTPKEDAA